MNTGKIKKIKAGNIHFLFALLIILFITTCNNQLSEPADTGYLRLSFNGARTIMPDTPSLAEMTYFLLFTDADGSELEPLFLDFEDFSNSIELPEGTYDLEISAFLYEGLIARDFITGVVISAGGETVCGIELKPIIIDIDEEGLKGIFKWDIQFIDFEPENIEGLTVTLVIDLLDPETFELLEEAIFSDDIVFNYSLDLPVGYYNVRLEISKPGTNPIIIDEVLYVFCNLESVLELELTPAFFMGNVHTVTFKLGNGEPDETAAVNHGDVYSLTLPGNIYRTGYIFDGWWTKDGSEDEDWGIKWDPWIPETFSLLKNLIFKDFNLYAKWIPHVFSIELSAPEYYRFAAIDYGNTAQTPYSVIITNTGNQPTGNLTIALSGTNAASFELSTASIGSIEVDAAASFTVVPRTGLALGSYTATVTVSGSQITSCSFIVNLPDIVASRIRTIGGADSDIYQSVISDSQGGIVAVGYSQANTFGNGDFVGFTGRGGVDAIIVRYHSNGELDWLKNFGGIGNDYFRSVTEVPDGYIAVGFSDAVSFNTGDFEGVIGMSGSYHAIIVKYNFDGTIEWKKNLRTNAVTQLISVITVSNGFVAAGCADAASFGTGDLSGLTGRGGFDAIIVKYNFNGEIEWVNNVGGSGTDVFLSVTEVSDGFIAAGRSGAASFGNGNYAGLTGRGDDDTIVVKFNNNGEFQWAKNFGGSGGGNLSTNHEQFNSVIAVSDGFIAVGQSPITSFGNGDWVGITGKGNENAIIVKYNSVGDIQWARHFGGNGSNRFYSITQVLDGYIAVGFSTSTSFSNGDWSGVTGRGNEDAIMVKYDTNGNIIWRRHFGGSISDYFYSITAFLGGFVVAGVTSSFTSGAGNGDLAGITGRGDGDFMIVWFEER